MAQIKTTAEDKCLGLPQFFGLNESQDGDTLLKPGEAAVMRNFCITKEGSLKKRPGTKTLIKPCSDAVKCLWSGKINGRETLLAAADNTLWRLFDSDSGEFISEKLGYVNTEGSVHIFPFNGSAYILDGSQYLCYDGTMLDSVEGYRPLVAVTVLPDGSGELLEGINRLNGMRRAWLSPDGESVSFRLPEEHILSLDYVLDTASGARMEGFRYDDGENAVIFDAAPARAVNSIEVGWTVGETLRDSVEKMHFSELFSGSTDARVFLYSEQSAAAIYSGLDYNGSPRADYFPELNTLTVGDENSGITGMLRHYSRLMIFKESSAWSLQYAAKELSDGSTEAAFYLTPVNRSIGNEAAGQIQLVLNSPVCLYGGGIYEWKNQNAYWDNITVDERQVRRISDRVYSSLADFDFSRCVCFDDNRTQEYYICCGDRALVLNYAVNAWYEYTGLEICSFAAFRGMTLIATADGRVMQLSDKFLGDDERKIHAYWESGSMSFGADNLRKYSAMLWVAAKPQDSGEIYVTVQTDRSSDYRYRLVTSDLSSFKRWNFARFSFSTNRKPRVSRLKIKAKKFVYLKLIFESDSNDTTATVLSADVKLRSTGYVK